MNMLLAPSRNSTYTPEEDPSSTSISDFSGFDLNSGLIRSGNSPRITLNLTPHGVRFERHSPFMIQSLPSKMIRANATGFYRKAILEAISAAAVARSGMPFRYYFGHRRPRILALLHSIAPSQEDDFRDTVLARLQRLESIGENWDTYGGASPSDKAIASAKRVIEFVGAYLTPVFGRNAQPAVIAPLSDGGVLLEWRTESTNIEVESDDDGELSLLLIKRNSNDESFDERENVSLPEIVNLLLRALVS